MGNNLVGEIVEKMKVYNPDRKVVKIWNKDKLSIILACYDPDNWMGEMDPYYAYNGERIDGLSVTINMPILEKVCTDKYLIYDREG